MKEIWVIFFYICVPVRDPDDTENDVESEVDSDLEEGIQAITEGRGLDKADPQKMLQATELNEWQKMEVAAR